MRRTVTEADTAASLGSGDVPVLATPRLIAWFEAATLEAVAPLLDATETSVGTAIRIEHQRATAVGAVVRITAAEPKRTGRHRLSFPVVAHDADGRVVAHGEIDRAIVQRARFLAAAGGQ